MKKYARIFLLPVILFTASFSSAQNSSSGSPVIKEADGFVIIPNMAMPPDKNHIYKAIFDATKAAKTPSEIIPAINMAGSELNGFKVSGVPLKNAKFVLVFHGAAINGIRDDAYYKAKFGISNPIYRY